MALVLSHRVSRATTKAVPSTCGFLNGVPCGQPDSLSQAIDVEGVMALQLPLRSHARQGSVPKRWLGPFCLCVDVRKEGLHVRPTLSGAVHPQYIM